MKKPTYLLVYPNPFARLDHQGVPAATYPFDPSHSPDRRWVGAAVDHMPGADRLPRTRRIYVEGDLTAVIRKGRLQGKMVNVDRAPRKRIAFAFNLQEPAKLPATSGHYLLGLRERSLLPADKATAEAAGVPFVDPKKALRMAAEHAIAIWKREHGEPPDTSLWPGNLQEVAGEEPEAPKAEAPPEGVASEAMEAAYGAGGGTA